MALNFASSSQFVEHASTAELSDQPATTVLMWIYPTVDTFGVVSQKLAGSGERTINISSGGRFRLVVKRASAQLDVLNASSTIPTFAINKWNFIAIAMNAGGTNADQRVYGGDLDTPAVEASSYQIQTVGSGSILSEAASALRVGANVLSTQFFPGHIALLSACNRTLSLEEIQAFQFVPRPINGSVFLVHYGLSSGSQIDLISGNNGTITGATIAGTHASYRLPFFKHSAAVVGADTGSTVGRNLSDSLTFSDEISVNTEAARDQEDGTAGAFSDSIVVTVIQAQPPNVTVSVTLLESFTFDETPARDIILDRTLSG